MRSRRMSTKLLIIFPILLSSFCATMPLAGICLCVMFEPNQVSMLTNPDIVRTLEEDIVFGVFHPKERLTEEGLMAQFNLKRHLVRDALGQLEAMGLVIRVPNRGAFVRELTPQEVIEIYEVREILEVAAALRTPLPAPRNVIEKLKEIQDQHSAAIAKNE